ncbi:DNA topoisomerase (ATP-hydrolyzing) subunit B [Patescibacteria group bacterium]|nr:DNA topoisomerase (ATP-hydrolyzing) subunit B [Patescibacteria group bacterium]
MLKKPEKSTTKPKDKKQAYSAAQISVLEGLDPVRKRPGMYVGNTGKEGLHHLVWEVIDNSIDEAMMDHANEISIILLPDSTVSVTDNGRGIPVDRHPTAKVSALEVVMTKLHAGGKFGQGGYKVSGGLHGVGVSVVNALSEWTRAEVKRDGKLWVQEYKRGKPLKKVKSVGSARGTGTTIIFKPDDQIFTTLEFDWDYILDHLRQQAYLTKGVKITINDERTDQTQFYSFYFEGGIASYVKHINRNHQPKHESVFYVEKESQGINVEVAVQYVEDYKENVFSFANNIHTVEGGSHLVGFRTALTRTLNAYAKNKGILKDKDDALQGEDTREGLTGIISVKVPEPQFEGQTKAKLGNEEVRPAVDGIFSAALAIWLEEHPREAEAIIGKALLAAQARKAARAARDTVLRKGALEGFALPGKLADCSSKDPEECELYIVEGDSAGGCFSGDTKVALTDGRNITFKELIKEHNQGKQNYCYTVKSDGSAGVAPIKHPRITHKNAEVIKVILDTDEEITCTPDHKFMLRDGSYKEARNLTSEDSLMPLRKKISAIKGRITIKGYEMVLSPATHRWIFTHVLSDRYNLEKGMYQRSDGDHKHHKDYNKLNNNPDNLVRMSPEKRDELRRIAVNQWNDEDLRNWRKEKTKEQWTEEFRQKRKKAYNQTYLNKALSVLHNIFRNKGLVDENEYQRVRFETNDKSLLRYSTICDRFFGGDESRMTEAVQNYNHNIKQIILVKEKIDVYDLEVEDTHNFALASGVFVHNSAKQGRDRRFQAILPLRGKILNVERARIDKMLANNEIKSLVIALGTNIGEMFNIDDLRYGRIIIMTDADVDGAHIRTLLLTLFFRYFPDLIHQGHLYIAQPPLYQVQKGKQSHYAYSDAELQKLRKSMDPSLSKKEEASPEESEGSESDDNEAINIQASSRINIQRYKGLGEMNPIQLWETTMDPQTRLMHQVTIEDVEKANEIFDILMGTEVPARKKFIQTHAKDVQNLDI